VTSDFLHANSPPHILYYEGTDRFNFIRYDSLIVNGNRLLNNIATFSLNVVKDDQYLDSQLIDSNQIEIIYSSALNFFSSFALPRIPLLLAYRPLGISIPPEILRVSPFLPAQVSVNGTVLERYNYIEENGLILRIMVEDVQFGNDKEIILFWEKK